MCDTCESSEFTLPTGPKGADGVVNSQVILGLFPRGFTTMYSGTLVQFVSDFPDGLGTGNWTGWAWANGANGTVDSRGKFPVLLSDLDNDYNDMAKTGGAKTFSLTSTNIPSHSHTITIDPHIHTGTITEQAHTVAIPELTHTASSPAHGHGSSTVTHSSEKSYQIPGRTLPGDDSTTNVAGITHDTASFSFGGSGSRVNAIESNSFNHTVTIASTAVTVNVTAHPAQTISTTPGGSTVAIASANTSATNSSWGGNGSGVDAVDNRPPYFVYALVVKL